MVKRQERDPRAPNPRRLMAIAQQRLAGAADPRRAEGAKAYFKKWEPVVLFGVTTPDVRALARELAGTVRGAWQPADAIEFCELCLRQPEMELKMVGVLVLARYSRSFPRELFATAKGWLAANLCGNWALVDGLAPSILTPLLVRYPGLMKPLAAWTRSRNLWVRRAALVALLRFAHEGKHLAEVYQFVLVVADDKEDLMHKAAGWLLREAGKTDMARLERFLLAEGPRLHRTTVRYAIERFPRGRRLLLLRATRSSEGIEAGV